MNKINRLVRKYQTPCMWGAGGLIITALLVSHIFKQQVVADIVFATAFVLAGLPVIIRAVLAIKLKTVSIELLVSIAALGAMFIGEFNESAIVTFLFQFGTYLEQKTIKKTRSAIRELTDMAPATAFRVKDEDMEEIDADEIEVGDILLVKAGNQIASDGNVIKGEGYVKEASITGEPMPKYKKTGDSVYSGTFLDSGTIYMEASKVGEDTTFAKIIALVEEAQDAKSPEEKFIDKFAKYYTPFVIIMAVIVFLLVRDIDTAITVLVLACPGALVIGAPIANVAGIGRGAREGILLKGGDTISTFSKTDTIVFDKTGTLTVGSPEVTKEYFYGTDREMVLKLAVAIEHASDHPIAKAVEEYAGNSENCEIENAGPVMGMGMEGLVNGHRVLVGNLRLMEQKGVEIAPQVFKDVSRCREEGSGIAIICIDGKIKMLLAVSDVIKDDAKDCISGLKHAGIKNIIMLTGDNSRTAENVSVSLGISEYRAELLPDDKLNVIKEYMDKGRNVTFVGDGINDSPALAAADTGIAMGSGTDVAIDSSDVVLIKSDLESLVKAVRLSRRTTAVLRENIAIAIGTVILLLAGLFAGYVHMSVGMLIHEASILVVIFNAMRLLVSDFKFNGRRKEK